MDTTTGRTFAYDMLRMGRSSIDLYANDIGAPFVAIASLAACVGVRRAPVNDCRELPTSGANLSTFVAGHGGWESFGSWKGSRSKCISLRCDALRESK